jgi:hypothetical protein
MHYGVRLRAAWPPMVELSDEAQVFDWLARLAAAH